MNLLLKESYELKETRDLLRFGLADESRCMSFGIAQTPLYVIFDIDFDKTRLYLAGLLAFGVSSQYMWSFK